MMKTPRTMSLRANCLEQISERDAIVIHRLLASLGMAPELFIRLTGERMQTLPANVIPLDTTKA